MFVGLVLIVINKSINIVIMSNIFYGGNLIYSHGKIKEELKNDKLRNIYCEKIINKILKGKIYNYVSYYKYYRLEILNNYIIMYYDYIETELKKIKALYLLRNLDLIDDIKYLLKKYIKNLIIDII